MLNVDIWECKPSLIQSQLVWMESYECPLSLKHVTLTLCERNTKSSIRYKHWTWFKIIYSKDESCFDPQNAQTRIYITNDNQSLWTSTKQLLPKLYLVALAMTRRDGLSSRMIQSRRISTLPSFWNHVSISTESPLSRLAPSIPRKFQILKPFDLHRIKLGLRSDNNSLKGGDES